MKISHQSSHPDSRLNASTTIADGALKYLHIFLVLAFATLCAMVLHYFFQYSGHAPYLATDDALVNISYSLSHLGRLGLQHSPLQPFTDSLRTDGYFNSGHWYFFVGGALSWLFGPSLEIQRAIHPVGLILVATLALFVFWRESLAAAGGLGAVLLYVFHYAHWPMVRPDVMVAILAGASIAATTYAINTERLKWWFLAAFLAAAAATQHLIAWALAPAMLVIWILSSSIGRQLDGAAFADASPTELRRRRILSFIAAGAGATAAFLVFLIAMEFRILELMTFLSGYFHERSDPTTRGGYFVVLASHYLFTWESIPVLVRHGAAAGFGLAVAILVILPRLPLEERRRSFALLFPPVTMAVAYQLSLGLYANTHAGYAILGHVTVFWSAAAAIAVLVRLAQRLLPRLRRLPEIALTIVVLLAMSWEVRSFVVRPSTWMTAATQWVGIEDYIDAAFSPLPKDATSWGTVSLGLEAGLRAAHVYFIEGLILTHWFKPEERDQFAPEFIVLGNYDLNTMAAAIIKEPIFNNQPLRSRPIPFDLFTSFFPDRRYELVHLVTAPPYGIARVYQRFPLDSAATATAPSVLVNDGTSRQWSSRLLPEIAATFKRTATVSFDLPYAKVSFKPTEHDNNGKSLVADLPSGIFLIAVSIERKLDAGSGMLIATTTSNFVGQNSEVGHGFVPTPYFAYEKTVHMLVSHQGGSLYLTQFDSDQDASFEVLKVQPIQAYQHVVSDLPLPPLDQWKVVATNPKVVFSSPEALEMIGDSSQFGYQLMSPELPVEPYSDITISIPIEQKMGRISVGILDGMQRWLVFPRADSNIIKFNSARWDRLTIVIANMNTPETTGSSEFVMRRGKKIVNGIQSSRTYVDELAKCHRTRRHLNPELCRVGPDASGLDK